MIRRSFQPQFEPLILAGTKIHTIRPTPKRLPFIGEEFVGYVWTGKPYRTKQREFFRSTIVAVETVKIEQWRWIRIGRKQIHTLTQANDVAVADGFECYAALLLWFCRNHSLPFTGILIGWATPVNRLLSPVSCLRKTASRLQLGSLSPSSLTPHLTTSPSPSPDHPSSLSGTAPSSACSGAPGSAPPPSNRSSAAPAPSRTCAGSCETAPATPSTPSRA
jgi:hypothetical protein